MRQQQLERAQLLMTQGRTREAETILGGLLSGDPHDVQVLYLLARTKYELDENDEAMKLIDQAIGLAPGFAPLFHMKAMILAQQEKLKESEEYLAQAVEIDPSEAEYYALWANVLLWRKKFEEALDKANEALALEPDNVLALNTRSTAQLKLNQKEEAFDTIEGALKEDPDNAYTHANYGWGHLEKGDHNKALEHFSEALRKDPGMELAIAGMSEALKARYLVYRWFLKYAFWMGNLSGRYQWGVLIAFYLAFRGLKNLARTNDAWQPFIYPILGLMYIFAISTWVMRPLSNLFLRLNKYGRYTLDEEDIKSSNLVGISAGVMLLGLLGYLVAGEVAWIGLAFYGFSMMIPLGSVFSPSRYSNGMILFTGGMAVVGALAVGIAFIYDNLFNGLSIIFLLGILAYQWIANLILIRKDTF